jgi:opacity protein-like surface antigen
LPLAAAHAQAGYGLAAGLSAPTGDFGKVADVGYHVTGLVSYAPPLAPVGIRVEGSFSEYNYNNTFTRSAKARLLYATAKSVRPYVIGGVGIYRASTECSTCTTTSTIGGINSRRATTTSRAPAIRQMVASRAARGSFR